MSEDFHTAREALERYAERILPRILTQLDRDPTSPTYGCADRNWWHYKIRDFPSVILQQAGESVWLASQSAEPAEAEALRDLAAAACRFWNARATRYGAFEEYYPYERGYPPLAFSTLAVAKLVGAGAVPAETVRDGLTAAASQLRRRFEAEALNQQAAGVAGLAWVRRVEPDLVPPGDLERITSRLLGMQHAEGWFPEYGGPDVGYLSVTVDCLWDAFDATADPRFVESAERAVGFIVEMASHHAGSPGMLNSRNTDYVVPYGLARTALECTVPGAARAFGALFRGADLPGHALGAVDDRYLCHYVGASTFRSLELLRDVDALPEMSPTPAVRSWWPGAGYWHGQAGSIRLAVALRKGGVFTGTVDGHRVADFGWQVAGASGTEVSHWWSDEWSVAVEGAGIRVQGLLVPVQHAASSPVRHVALRALAFALGARIIARLKRRLIFRKAKGACRFERSIEIVDGGIVVRDVFEGLPGGAVLLRAPRASRRHVASADSAHPEDLVLNEIAPHEERELTGDRCVVVTRWG